MASDLHCHTKISDGSMGIEELIAIAKRRGLSAISVTDHDTTAAATRAVIIGRRQEVRVIHGVEFSTIDKARGNEAHLLCYLCDTPDRLEGLCRRTGESRRQAAMAMVRKVMRYYPITPELIVKCATGSTNIYKQHIMHALMDAGYADSIYGELYQKLFSPETGSALVEPEYPDVKEVLELIHSAGGSRCSPIRSLTATRSCWRSLPGWAWTGLRSGTRIRARPIRPGWPPSQRSTAC